MVYLSLDIETTGLNPKEHDILEIGAYIEDTNRNLGRELLPCFHVYIWKETYRGNAYALAMNARILKKITELKKANDPSLVNPEDVASKFGQFIFEHRHYWPDDKFINQAGPFNLDGKNLAGFDLQFLKELDGWSDLRFHRRILDPAILYWVDNDTVLPDLSECKERAGLNPLVTHEALDDAWDTIRLLRKGL